MIAEMDFRNGCRAGPDYTPEEADVIRSVYPAGGAAAVRQQLPHRTAASIKIKAIRLGVKTLRHAYHRLSDARGCCPGPVYTEAEKATIRSVYPVSGPQGVHKILPHRSTLAISVKASKMGVLYRVPAIINKDGGAQQLKQLARSAFRKAHSEIGCRVRLVMRPSGYTQIKMQSHGEPDLELIDGTVGFYSEGCTIAQILEDVAHCSAGFGKKVAA